VPDSGGGVGQLGGTNFVYNGSGPVIANVAIHLIFLQDALTHNETSPAVQAQLHAFFNTITSDSYIPSILGQYSIPGFTIGNGTIGADDANVQVTPDQPNFSGTHGAIDDLQTIQPLIKQEIDAGRTAAPAPNNLYFVFTPPGDAFTGPAGDSVSGTLGYHDSLLDDNGVSEDYYAVIADPGAPNQNLAEFGLTTDALQDLTLVSSHELAEAITDPTPNTEWTDANTGLEVADMAQPQAFTQDGYLVQYLWSNALEGPAHSLGTTAQNLFINQVSPQAVDTWMGGPVATFTDRDPALTASSFTAFVDLFDGRGLLPATVGGGAQGVYTVSANLATAMSDGQKGSAFDPAGQAGMQVQVYDTHSLAIGQGAPFTCRYSPFLVSASAPLTYNADSGGIAHNFVLKENNTTHNFELTDNGNLVFTQPIAQTTAININADSGGTVDSSLTIDYSGGVFSNNVTFDGGKGTGSHILTLEGTHFTSDVLTSTGPGAGNFQLDGQTVTFSHVTATNDLTKGSTGHPATHLALINPLPPSSVTSGASFAVNVAAEDATNATDSNYSGSVALAVTTGPGSFNAGDVVTLLASGGVVDFSSLHLNQAGAYTIQVTSGSLTALSFSLTVNPQKFSFTMPNSVQVNSPFTVVVTALNADGTTATNFSGAADLLTLTVASGPGNLSGTIPESPSQGQATFANLKLDTIGSYTFTVNGGGITGTSANSITVSGPAFSFSMPSTIPSIAPFTVVVTSLNPDGTVAKGFTNFGPLTLASGPGKLSVGAVTISNGVATFANVRLDAAGFYTLQISGGGATATSPQAIEVTANHLVFKPGSTPATLLSGQQFGLTVLAEDALGHIDPNFGGSITIAINTSAGGGGTLAGTLTIAATAGIADFSGLFLDKATTYTLSASAGGLNSAKTGNIVVTASQLAILLPQSQILARNYFVIQVTARDINNQLATNFADGLALTITSGPAMVGSTWHAAANGGLANFNLSLPTRGMYSISVSDPGKALTASTTITVTTDIAPTLAAIPNQTMAQGASKSITLSYGDTDGDPLSLSFQSSNPLYTALSPLQLYAAGPANNPYYLDFYGKQEKWLRSKVSGNWFAVFPNGSIYAFTRNPVNPFGTLVGSFGPGVYAVPTQLTNVKQVTVNFSMVGKVLTITPPASYTGLIQVTVTVSDGFLSASRTFTVTVT
jgi:hypothetical protein